MTEFNDDIAGIFDHLTPDMFIAESSAVDEIEGKFVGTDAFNASVDERIRGIRAAFASSFGQINPLAVLSNATTQRVFVPQQDENLGLFLQRLQREAMTMGAHWFFFAKRNVFSVYYRELADDDERHDVASSDSEREAMIDGTEPEVGILWYAERREGGEVHHRQGVLEIKGHRLGDATEGDGKQALGVFSTVLDVVRR